MLIVICCSPVGMNNIPEDLKLYRQHCENPEKHFISSGYLYILNV